MSRFIDADTLKERCKGTPALEKVLHGLFRIIDEQPTAYDPDEIIEQLKQLESDAKETWNEIDDEQAFGEYIAYVKSIDIVKAGGI